MVKLSIIIPVYNVEKYLTKCLDSVLVDNAFTGQVICVNDGSTDGSGKILEQYAAKYPNVETIAQPNAGLSAARNAGIKAAKGEYVVFLDSDDYWETKVLDGLLAQIDREELDVLRFKYQNVRVIDAKHIDSTNLEYEVFQPYKRDSRLDNDYSETVTDGVTFLNERMNTQCYAVLYIVRRALLEGCIFTEGIYFEDTDWTPRMLVRAKRVASTDMIVYNYLVREGSITNAVNRSKQKKVLDDKMRLVETMQQQSKKLKEQGRANRWFTKLIADTVISIITILGTQFYVERKEYLAKLEALNVYPIQSRIAKARLINLSPRLAVEVLHIKN